MTSLIPFDFNGKKVSVVTDDSGAPWFVAMEVAGILGYSDAEAMTRRLDEDEKQNLRIVGFGPRGVTVVSEAGLYASILASQKEEAKRFKRWVMHDVLPSIRQTGSYVAPSAKAQSALEPAKEFKALFSVAKLIGLDKNAAAISANQAVAHLTGTNILALLGHTHLETPEQQQYFTPTELGEQINLSARKVNLLLAEAGFQAKRGEVWEVMDAGREFAKIYDTGKKHGSGVPIQQIKWSALAIPLLKQGETA